MGRIEITSILTINDAGTASIKHMMSNGGKFILIGPFSVSEKRINKLILPHLITLVE